MEYKLICNNFYSSLNEEINEALKNGWKLYGSPFSNNGYFCQALTKTTNEDDEKNLLM